MLQTADRGRKFSPERERKNPFARHVDRSRGVVNFSAKKRVVVETPSK
jgi:hypothetical protein